MKSDKNWYDVIVLPKDFHLVFNAKSLDEYVVAFRNEKQQLSDKDVLVYSRTKDHPKKEEIFFVEGDPNIGKVCIGQLSDNDWAYIIEWNNGQVYCNLPNSKEIFDVIFF